MHKALALIDAACTDGARVAAFCCAALSLLLVAEVALTALLNYWQPWAVEHSAYLTSADDIDPFSVMARLARGSSLRPALSQRG